MGLMYNLCIYQLFAPKNICFLWNRITLCETQGKKKIPERSLTLTSSPVALPVNITPSAKKNSAAFTVSNKLTSEVIACEL